jgi:hypothetical protein
MLAALFRLFVSVFYLLINLSWFIFKWFGLPYILILSGIFFLHPLLLKKHIFSIKSFDLTSFNKIDWQNKSGNLKLSIGKIRWGTINGGIKHSKGGITGWIGVEIRDVKINIKKSLLTHNEGETTSLVSESLSSPTASEHTHTVSSSFNAMPDSQSLLQVIRSIQPKKYYFKLLRVLQYFVSRNNRHRLLVVSRLIRKKVLIPLLRLANFSGRYISTLFGMFAISVVGFEVDVEDVAQLRVERIRTGLEVRRGREGVLAFWLGIEKVEAKEAADHLFKGEDSMLTVI